MSVEFWTTSETITDVRGFQFRTITFEGNTIEQLRSPRAAPDAEFLPDRVLFGDREVWSFAKDHKSRGFTGIAMLRVVEDEMIIVTLDRQRLYEVIPVRDLAKRQRVGKEYIGGRKLAELVELKELIASTEGIEPVWSGREAILRSTVAKDLAVSRQAAKAEEEANAEEARARRRAERDARRAEIAGRQRVFAHTLSGDRRHGRPVVGDEWLMLGHGAFCISVASYEPETGRVGEVIESFIVKMVGTRKTRHAVTAVTLASPAATGSTKALEDITFAMVPVKGRPEEVIVTSSMDVIRALRDRGLNSGTLAMCPKAGDDGRYSVFSLTEGKIVPVTEVMRKV